MIKSKSNMNLEQIAKKLKKDHHILSKNYHDGAGRQFWLRDKNQDKVTELNKTQVSELTKMLVLTKEHVMSSDEAFILATKSGHEAWG